MTARANNIFHEGRLANGNQFTIVGRPLHGTAARVNQAITKVGQDSVVVLPRYNVVGVFDGAGGTTDIGSPEKAALTAAQAVGTYFEGGGEELLVAMEFARDAVKNDQAAGLCVGALARFCGETVQAVNAGDSGVVGYDDTKGALEIITEQQEKCGLPTNYLGRNADGFRPPIADVSAHYQQSYRSSNEVYVLSDGVLGSRQLGNGLEDYHFKAAHNEYQVLHAARTYDKAFEENIRMLLSGAVAMELRERQLEETGHVESPELDDPLRFSATAFDWAIWQEIVQPYIQSLQLPQIKLSARAICESLLARPISWSFERSPHDDASIVMIQPSSGS